MEEFDKITINATKADVVGVTAGSFSTEYADIMLMSATDFANFQQSYDSDDSPVLMPFTDKLKLTPDNPSGSFTIPETGPWIVVFQPWSVSVTAAVR